MNKQQFVKESKHQLVLCHAIGKYQEVSAVTEVILDGLIGSGKFLGKQYYALYEVPQLLKLLSQPRRWSPPAARDYDRIRSYRRRGKTLRETASLAGCSLSTAKRRLDQSTILGNGPTHRRFVIQALHEDGWSDQDISEQLEVCHRTIRRALVGLDKSVISAQ